jgi:hypothetical protein
MLQANYLEFEFLNIVYKFSSKQKVQNAIWKTNTW